MENGERTPPRCFGWFFRIIHLQDGTNGSESRDRTRTLGTAGNMSLYNGRLEERKLIGGIPYQLFIGDWMNQHSGEQSKCIEPLLDLVDPEPDQNRLELAKAA